MRISKELWTVAKFPKNLWSTLHSAFETHSFTALMPPTKPIQTKTIQRKVMVALSLSLSLYPKRQWHKLLWIKHDATEQCTLTPTPTHTDELKSCIRLFSKSSRCYNCFKSNVIMHNNCIYVCCECASYVRVCVFRSLKLPFKQQ